MNGNSSFVFKAIIKFILKSLKIIFKHLNNPRNLLLFFLLVLFSCEVGKCEANNEESSPTTCLKVKICDKRGILEVIKKEISNIIAKRQVVLREHTAWQLCRYSFLYLCHRWIRLCMRISSLYLSRSYLMLNIWEYK